LYSLFIRLENMGCSGMPCVVTFQSGLVQNFTGARNSLTLQDGARPNATGQPLTLDRPTTGEWFNTAAVVIPPQGVVGNGGRDVIRGPAQQYWDFATHKSFRVREVHRPFRAAAALPRGEPAECPGHTRLDG
jgi:hypothetical protein